VISLSITGEASFAIARWLHLPISLQALQRAMRPVKSRMPMRGRTRLQTPR
jgi:hypothetical protein